MLGGVHPLERRHNPSGKQKRLGGGLVRFVDRDFLGLKN